MRRCKEASVMTKLLQDPTDKRSLNNVHFEKPLITSKTVAHVFSLYVTYPMFEKHKICKIVRALT
jgi:hypothetical protein